MPCTRVEVEDKGGVKFFAHEVGDAYFTDLAGWEEADYGAHLQKVKDLELRPDDVITTGFPKSGNHWLFEIMSMVQNDSSTYSKKTFADDHLDVNDVDKLIHSPPPRLLGSHLNIKLLPKQIVDKKVKVIYLVRNFKDISVSWYEFCKVLKKYVDYKGQWEDYLDLEMRGKFMYGSWFDHVRDMDAFIQQHPDVPVYVLCFEKMKENTVAEIEKLCRFLGRPESVAASVAERTAFKSMKNEYRTGKNREWVDQACKPGGDLLRKGVVGDWKNKYTVAQSEMVDAVFKDKLTGSPVGDLVRPYMVIE